MFILQSFDEIGLASYAFDLSPDQLQSALKRLDSMMGQWFAKNIDLGYPLPVNPATSDLDDATNIAQESNEAIYLNLAVRIAPSFGKSVSQETKAGAKSCYDTLLIAAAFPDEQQLPAGVPLGAGNRRFDQPFTLEPE